MDAFQFTCPHCSGRLRLRQRMFVGRQVNCPDCDQPLLITEQKGELAVEIVAATSPGSGENSGGHAATQLALPAAKTALATWSRSPLFIAWTAAGICVTGLFGFLLLRNPGGGSRQDTSKELAEQPAASDVTANPSADMKTGLQSAPTVAVNGEKTAQETVAQNSALTKEQDTEVPVVDPSTASGSVGDAAKPARVMVALSDDKPIDPEFAEPPPPEPRRPKTEAEIAAALKQPILSFQQSQSATLGDMLREVAAMAGIVVTWDAADLGSAEPKLNQPVSLKLDKTTVGTILDKLLDTAKLTYRIEPGKIRIVLKPPT